MSIDRLGNDTEAVEAVDQVDVDTLVARPDLPAGSFTLVASGDPSRPPWWAMTASRARNRRSLADLLR